MARPKPAIFTCLASLMGMEAIGSQCKRCTAVLAKRTLTGASASARFLRGKLPVLRGIWNKLPEKGWPSGLVGFLKRPPRWFVGPSLILAIWVGACLLLRLVYSAAPGPAEDANKLMLGLAGLLGAPFLVWRTWIADRQRHIAQEDLYTGLLVKAVEQLGATREEKIDTSVKTVPNTELRLGAIYALEKLAHDYGPLHRQIVEILCAYVRKNAGLPNPLSGEFRSNLTKEERVARARRQAELRPSVDVQAALIVIGRRSNPRKLEEKQSVEADGAHRSAFLLDLKDCHLAGVDLQGLRFERADFARSCLQCAQLHGTYFNGADFGGTHLEEAIFSDAHLEGSHFICARVDETIFSGAHLDGANLYSAEGLTQEMLNSSYGDEATTLPENLARPSRWRNAALIRTD